MSMEVEAKFVVDDLVSFNRLKSLGELAGFTLTGGEDVSVHDGYWDTPGRALLAAGWALRFRAASGRLLVTAKSLTPATGPLHEREELEISVERFGQPRDWPDGELRRKILPLIGDEHLAPLFEVDQRRFVRVAARDGRGAVEISLDQVELLAGGRHGEYCELEVELLPGGTREDLASILAALEGTLSLVPASRSKFEEGLHLLDGGTGLPQPVRRGAPRRTAMRRPAPQPGRTRELEVPAGVSHEAVLSELERLGYRSSVRSLTEETRIYFDTQSGSLLKQGRELYFSPARTRWHLLQEGSLDKAQRGDPEAPPSTGLLGLALKPLTRGHTCIPYLEARLRQTVLSVQSISTPRLRLAVRAWEFRSLLHDAPAATALTLSLDGQQVSPIEHDYLLGLLENSLGIRELGGTLLRLGLNRVGVPVPGTPLPREFLPADGDSMATVCSRILSGEAWRMKANTPGAIRDLDAEFVHDLRVATRRARFACRLFKKILGKERQERIRSELSWIAGLLGGVRDADVLRGRLESQAARAGVLPAHLEQVAGLLEARRRAAREALVPALESSRYAALLAELSAPDSQHETPADDAHGGPPTARAAEPATEPASEPATEPARRRTKKALARILPWTKVSPPEMSAVDLHRLRILFKRLRYTAEFFSPLLLTDVAPLVEECVVYQDCLGLHQDANAAAAALAVLAEDPSLAGSSAALLALGALLQVQREVMREQRERFSALWGSARELMERWQALLAGAEKRP